MSQANVAREPSMEEILASIRKIIESNEDEENAEAQSASRPEAQEDDGSDREAAAPVMRAANEQVRPQAPRDVAARPERAQTPQQAPTQRPAGAPGAPVQRAPQADAGAAARAAMQSNRKPVSLAEVAAEAENAAPGGQGEAIRPRPEEVAQAAQVRRETPQPQADRQGTADDPRRQQPAAPAPQPGNRAEAERSDARALISAEAGAKVAASFTGLNQALVKGPDRSFEQMAEDMLRPMLQQWLDDNLPTLVERLVREEIERVARGS